MNHTSTHSNKAREIEPMPFDGDLPKLIREAAPQIERMRQLGLLSFKEDREEAGEGQAGAPTTPLKESLSA